MNSIKLIRSKPATADFNMAFDAEIFNRYLNDNIPVLRIYSWQRPSFTFGFSQEPQKELNLSLCRKDNIQVAKRMTGGGVLFHDNEITYSIVLSKEDLGEERNVFVSFRRICSFLTDFYKLLGLHPVFALEQDDFKDKSNPHELCSASREKYDILINNRKIGGNAQKRRRQAVFQHGSIPLSINWQLMQKYILNFPARLPQEVTALKDELKILPTKTYLEDMLIRAFINSFDVKKVEEVELNEACLAK